MSSELLCLSVAALCALALSCRQEDAQTPARADMDVSPADMSGRDAGVIDMRPDAAQDKPDAGLDMGAPAPMWQRAYSDTATFEAPQGKRWRRSIVHLHSTHSHDACDDKPRLEGMYNMPCLMSLRQALCAARIDIAWLTDHPTHMTEVPFEDALLHLPQEGDALILEDQAPIANVISCADSSHKVLVRVGAEDELMPVGLKRHLSTDEAERLRLHNNRDQEAADAMRDAGALVWQAHSEERTIEVLRAVPLDGMEIYQLHANIDPNRREEWLGLDPTAPIIALAPFLRARNLMHPDLAFLAFLEDNTPSLKRWASLLVERPVVGSAGTDAHENVFRQETTDGERLDSYRRMMSWFSNYVLVDDVAQDLLPEASQRALSQGRLFIGFDVLGDPSGFGAWLEVEGQRHEIGASVSAAQANATLHFHAPELVGPTGIIAKTRWRVLVAREGDWQIVAEGDKTGDQRVSLDQPGAYRVELRTTAEHLRPLMPGYEDYAAKEFPWIVANAFRLNLP